MNTRIKVTRIALALLLSWAIFFGLGLYSGRHVAEKSIKSELIWYNQYILRQAVADMKDGKLDDAEKKILYVDNELNRMMAVHSKALQPDAPASRR